MDTPADAVAVAELAQIPADAGAQKRRPRPKLNNTLAAVLAHPVRCKIQTILDRQIASANQIAGALGLTLGMVAYHFREMAKMGVIEEVDQKVRRGATEHFFRVTVRPELTDEEFGELSLDERQALSREIFQLLCADAGSSLDERLFAARPDNYIYRNPFLVDEEGWQELGEVFDGANEGIKNVIAAVVNRRAADPDIPAFPVTAGLTFFERPEYDLPEAD